MSRDPSYNDFSWYKAGKWSTLEQGDLLTDCPILVPSGDLTQTLLKAAQGAVLPTPYDIQFTDLIILSQSCDLVNPNIKQVLLCAHFSADDYKRDERVSIRKEHRPPLHLVEGCEIEGHKFSQRVVDFRTIFTLPKEFVTAFADGLNSRVRLLPPYREHLAQAFARYFMRVGLPRPIKDK
jgi:hypothetical protein